MISHLGYDLWDIINPNNSKELNHCDMIRCNVKLKSRIKARKRLEKIRKKTMNL